MKQANLVIGVSRQLVEEGSHAELVAFYAPPTEWFLEGPRGGIYEALEPIIMQLSNDDADFFIMNQVKIHFRSAGVRYLRPGTQRYAYAKKRLEAEAGRSLVRSTLDSSQD